MRRPNWLHVIIVLIIAAGLSGWIAWTVSGKKALVFGLGLLLGLVLMQASYGFTTHWRRFLVALDGSGIRAQMVMLAVGSLLVLPVLAQGQILGHKVAGAIAPAGVSVAVGAFMFGLAMQLANGCASGTLYALGGGSTRMMITLVFFLIGSLWGSANLPFWYGMPNLGGISLVHKLGLWATLALQLSIFAAIFIATLALERRCTITSSANASPAKAERPSLSWRRILSGPWSWMAGGVLLAVLNFAVLAVTGHMWTISFGYTLWGGKIVQALGYDLSQVPFWTWPYPKWALANSWLAEDTSLSNLGIIIGAALATALAGGFSRPVWVGWRGALGAAIGGLLMGYGARIAFGCNVGAYFSGIISGSLHGWQWVVFGLMGTAIGVRLRPFFGLKNP